jgi:hypothetical protein
LIVVRSLVLRLMSNALLICSKTRSLTEIKIFDPDFIIYHTENFPPCW